MVIPDEAPSWGEAPAGGLVWNHKRFLPRCARGAISAFDLTEPAVGSDPARLSSIAEKSTAWEQSRYENLG